MYQTGHGGIKIRPLARCGRTKRSYHHLAGHGYQQMVERPVTRMACGLTPAVADCQTTFWVLIQVPKF